MEQHDFVNIYIGRLVKEVDELVKSKLLLDAKGEFKDAEISELRKKLADLEESSSKERDEVALTWKTALEEEEQTSTEKLASVTRNLESKNTNLATRLNDMHRELKDKEATISFLQEEINALKKPKIVVDEPKAEPEPEPEPKASVARRKKNSKKETTVLLE